MLNDIKQRRKAIGLTQADLARRCRWSTQYLCMVESGKEIPGEDALKRIDDALDGKQVQERVKVPFDNEEEKTYFRELWLEKYSPLPKN